MRIVRRGRGLAKRWLRGWFGRDLVPFSPAFSPDAMLLAYLEYHAVDLVLDVGAAGGHYARMLFDLGYRGSIVSFEPLPEEHAALCALAMKRPRLRVADRCALGDRSDERTLRVCRRRTSSSLLAPITTDTGESDVTEAIQVPVRRLDEMAGPYLAGSKRVLAKLDVQGFEDRVMDGMTGILDRVVGMQVELSLVTLYKGQPLFPAMLERLKSLGFDPWGFMPVHLDPCSSRTLQVDGLFFRPSMPPPGNLQGGPDPV